MSIPPEMPDPATIALGVCAIVLFVLLLALRNQRRRNHSIRRRFRDLEGEEQRMFSFLHDLGLAIENEPSPSMLSRIIVDGIDKVVNARGGAVYFLGAGNEFPAPVLHFGGLPAAHRHPGGGPQKGGARSARA